jgi:Tfp pilus assembly protein PilO
MPYALRNSVILGVVLLMLVVCGWGYLYYFKDNKIDSLKTKLTHKKETLQKKKKIAGRYPAMAASYEKASKYYRHYQKSLYPNSDQTNVYDFLDRLNHGAAHNNFNFTFSDSITHKKYGVLVTDIKGIGLYSHVVNFIRGIELSKPLNKITDVAINPVAGTLNHDSVSYKFILKSFYDRSKLLGEASLAINYDVLNAVHNPFYPIIHTIQPNTDGKINISKSALIAVSSNRVFLIDQNGKMRKVKIGGSVYLGRLTHINLVAGKATFTLNEGGVIKSITLGIQQANP